LNESLFDTRAIHRPFDPKGRRGRNPQQRNYAAKVFQIRRKYGVTASIRQRDDNHTASRKFEIFSGFASGS